ncbi:MOSC domain-containing protein [[Limnothrix rosea] IAM M-220]|uniref:MOSC domain-containing protein n=1 Tax=[Limnothrix rosea] IAM M-220 TaxID=454133 RepID=UPI000962AB50|nr:MOSC domain-containing protein [[Limnothrix rosea] IAM M-220]OKH17116.1 sulfurase [[Limnothrix rosea] IAM M-220]
MVAVGTVEKIWIKRGKGAPMDSVERAELVQGKGLQNNADQRGWRQVTLLDAAVWERVMMALEADLDPSVRRANILVRGLDLTQSRGKILQLGDGQLKMLNETKPCERMDEVLPGLKAALYDNWGGGAFGRVVTSGQVWIGAKIYWTGAS